MNTIQKINKIILSVAVYAVVGLMAMQSVTAEIPLKYHLQENNIGNNNFSSIYAINSNDFTVGQAGSTGMVWDNQGNIVYQLPNSIFWNINDLENVCGTKVVGPERHAVAVIDGELINISLPPTDKNESKDSNFVDDSAALSINNNNQVVGYTNGHAFHWDQASGIKTLDELIAPHWNYQIDGSSAAYITNPVNGRYFIAGEIGNTSNFKIAAYAIEFNDKQAPKVTVWDIDPEYTNLFVNGLTDSGKLLIEENIFTGQGIRATGYLIDVTTGKILFDLRQEFEEKYNAQMNYALPYGIDENGLILGEVEGYLGEDELGSDKFLVDTETGKITLIFRDLFWKGKVILPEGYNFYFQRIGGSGKILGQIRPVFGMTTGFLYPVY